MLSLLANLAAVGALAASVGVGETEALWVGAVQRAPEVALVLDVQAALPRAACRQRVVGDGLAGVATEAICAHAFAGAPLIVCARPAMLAVHLRS